MAMYQEGKTMKRKSPSVWKDEPVDLSKVFQCRTPEFAWEKHEGEGYSIQPRFGKWETAGCKKIWHADLKKGLKVEYAYLHRGYDMFYVQRGKLQLTVQHTHCDAKPQTWIVEGDSIIDIPPYHTYAIQVLEDTVMYNYGG